MTFPDPHLESPFEVPRSTSPGNHQDIVPPTERGQDPLRDNFEHGLPGDPARPLSGDEKRAAAHDAPAGERVYAPASERVPKEPAPGHREFIEHTDTHTPERASVGGVGSGSPSSGLGSASSDPSFARVARPTMTTGASGAYASPLSNPGLSDDDAWSANQRPQRQTLFMGIGLSWVAVLGAAVGAWFFLRWRRERNKPINRLRRQAKQAVSVAADLRERLPDAEEATRPAMGLGTALLSILLLVWRQSRSRADEPVEVITAHSERARKRASKAAQQASDTLSDADWQKRLQKLKERWSAGRVELEKVSISRHH